MNIDQSFDDKATQVLRSAYGSSAVFRPDQLEAIDMLVNERSRLLLVQRTGWGKSVVYFVSTRLMRDRTAGPTLIVSPLLALMRDQIAAAERLSLNAVTINSSNTGSWDTIESEIERGSVDLILVSPERFNNEQFRKNVLGSMIRSIGLFVIDEAHCVSDWGHDFRPDYQRLSRVLDLVPSGVPVLATTATANDRVVSDVTQQLGHGIQVIRGPLNRDSLELHALVIPEKARRLAWIAREIPRLPGTGIVYCLTVGDAEIVAAWLESCGIPALAYSGETDPEIRLQVERELRGNKVKAVCATSALGMGFDKPDLGFVIHYQSPSSPVAYYQQVGRAGRAVDRAVVVLLSGREDDDIWDYFLTTSLPIQADAEGLVGLLEQDGGWQTKTWIQGHLNTSPTRLDGLLKILEVEGAVERHGNEYRRTLNTWRFDADRVDMVRKQRIAEQEAMRVYATGIHCRMAYLQEELDDPNATACKRCDNCTQQRYDADVPRDIAAQAAAFLRSRPVILEPRRQWPGGIAAGAIPRERQVTDGRALSRLGDGGWGDVILHCKRTGQPFPDDIVGGLVGLVRRWRPEPSPEWITYVPSLDPMRQFVPVLAHQLGLQLGLPVVDAVRKTRHTEPQKFMQNSQQQLRNIWSAYDVDDMVRPSPVLLVDDVADSRWTLTYVGNLLRRAGAGPVLPLTLARSRG